LIRGRNNDFLSVIYNVEE
jgi:hypothetical protein